MITLSISLEQMTPAGCTDNQVPEYVPDSRTGSWGRSGACPKRQVPELQGCRHSAGPQGTATG
jgi:hypothetical protein